MQKLTYPHPLIQLFTIYFRKQWYSLKREINTENDLNKLDFVVLSRSPKKEQNVQL